MIVIIGIASKVVSKCSFVDQNSWIRGSFCKLFTGSSVSWITDFDSTCVCDTNPIRLRTVNDWTREKLLNSLGWKESLKFIEAVLLILEIPLQNVIPLRFLNRVCFTIKVSWSSYPSSASSPFTLVLHYLAILSYFDMVPSNVKSSFLRAWMNRTEQPSLRFYTLLQKEWYQGTTFAGKIR